MRRVNERWTLIGCWKASEQASAKRLVTVDGVVEKSKPRCSNRMIPTTLQGREIPNGTFLRDRDVTEMRRTPESRHFYREQLYNLIRSHRFDFLSSNRTFPSSFISVSLFLISLRVLFFFFRSEEWTECFSKHFRKALYRTLVIASCRYSRETNYRRGESSAGNLNVSSIGESWNCADFMQLHDCI